MSKRSLADVLSGSNNSKRRANPLYLLKQEFAQLLGQKKEFINCQRRASLLIPPFETDSLQIQKRFAELFEKLTTLPNLDSMSVEYSELAKQLIQE